MPDPNDTRLSAAPIGRIICFETGLETGLLYRWFNAGCFAQRRPQGKGGRHSLVEDSNH